MVLQLDTVDAMEKGEDQTLSLLQSFRNCLGVPVLAQQKQIRLGTMRLPVQSWASLSGLRIQRCHELWWWSQTWLRSGVAWLWSRPAATAPIQPLAWVGTSMCRGPKKTKDKKKKKEKKKKERKKLSLRLPLGHLKLLPQDPWKLVGKADFGQLFFLQPPPLRGCPWVWAGSRDSPFYMNPPVGIKNIAWHLFTWCWVVHRPCGF